MLKILQARLEQYMNCELPDVQAGFTKGRGTRDQIANICWITEKARKFSKKIFCFIDYAKAKTTLPASCICMQVKKQQLESDIEQQTGSKLGKEYFKTVLGQPWGMGWDGREVGEGIRIGDTCIPMADSCQCMAKTTTIL